MTEAEYLLNREWQDGLRADREALVQRCDTLTARLTVLAGEAETLRVSLDWAVQEADKAFTRVAELEAAMQGLLAAVDTSPGATATADAVNAARAALGAERA